MKTILLLAIAGTLALAARAPAVEVLDGVVAIVDGRIVRDPSELFLRTGSETAGSELQKEARTLQRSHELAVKALKEQQLDKLHALLKRAQKENDRPAEVDILIAMRNIMPDTMLYVATASLEFSPPENVDGERLLRKLLPNDPFVHKLERTSNTAFFALSVKSPDAKFAAVRANELADQLVLAMTMESQGTLPPVRIVARAEKPLRTPAAAAIVLGPK
jgi:hypothetical protein